MMTRIEQRIIRRFAFFGRQVCLIEPELVKHNWQEFGGERREEVYVCYFPQDAACLFQHAAVGRRLDVMFAPLISGSLSFRKRSIQGFCLAEFDQV